MMTGKDKVTRTRSR